jgi:hypothetical protein
VLPTTFFIIEMPTEYKAKSTIHAFSLSFFYNFSAGFFKLCPSEVYIQAQVRNWKLNPNRK